MNDYLTLLKEKWYLTIPFIFIFLINIFITRQNGLEFVGKLAIFSFSSSFLAIAFALRWDLEVLVKEKASASHFVINGILITLVSSLLLSFIACILEANSIFGFNFYLIIISATLIAIHELLVNILLKNDQTLSFVLVRISQPILLFLFCSLTKDVASSWLLSYLFPALLLSIYMIPRLITLERIRKTLRSFVKDNLRKFIPTLSTLITNCVPLIWLILISTELGEKETGIWINLYRIFCLPIVFFGASLLPYMLGIMGDKEKNTEKFQLMSNFFKLTSIVLLISVAISYFYGDIIFSLLTDQDIELEFLLIGLVILIGFFQYSLQYSKEFFQSIDETSFFFKIVSIELVSIILIYYYVGFEGLLQFSQLMTISLILPFLLAWLGAKRFMDKK